MRTVVVEAKPLMASPCRMDFIESAILAKQYKHTIILPNVRSRYFRRLPTFLRGKHRSP